MFEASRWESLVWPSWLPVPARMPLVAQITGAVAFTALIVGPWWSQIPEAPVPLPSSAPHVLPVPLPRPVAPSPAVKGLDAAARVADSDTRPAHLNLDVRHTFGAIDLSVTVDGKPAFADQLDGGGKRFKMFGKRAERGFTHTLDLPPGVHVVRVRLKSTEAQFDQTRAERFDLGSASVAALRITADKSGMSLVANHPPPPPKPKPVAPAVQSAALPASTAPAVIATAAPIAQHNEQRTSPAESAVVELVHSLRSMLIAIAGFVASAATGFVVQEFLRRRKGLIFAEAAAEVPSSMERRRRRRAAAKGQRQQASATPE